MKQTTNYNLNKPDLTDVVDIELLNSNMDTIDAELAKKSDITHTHDDRYYTETEIITKLSSKSDAVHTHDDRYYTEAEIIAKLSGKSETGHAHDDRYYTETEVNNLLGGKANSSHTHTAGQISGLPTSLPANGGNSDTVDGFHVDLGVKNTYGLRPIAMDTFDLVAGSTVMTPGSIYIMYE